jgi:hypothetical protein
MNMEARKEIRLEERGSILEDRSFEADGREPATLPSAEIIDPPLALDCRAHWKTKMMRPATSILAPRFRSREIPWAFDASIRQALQKQWRVRIYCRTFYVCDR